jgi:hypothetical protein
LVLGHEITGEVLALQEAASGRNIPLRVDSYSDVEVRELYPKNFTLIRPDGHVAWRGDAFEHTPDAVLNIVTGRD